MKPSVVIFVQFLILIGGSSCIQNRTEQDKTAADILGNPNYLAMSYGGYREDTREVQPNLEELKEDMKILSAMGVKMIRTYNVHFPHAENVLKAIAALKVEDASFEMYVMLGAWIDCKNAFNREDGEPDHNAESERNPVEITTAVSLAQQYPDIVKYLLIIK